MNTGIHVSPPYILNTHLTCFIQVHMQMCILSITFYDAITFCDKLKTKIKVVTLFTSTDSD